MDEDKICLTSILETALSFDFKLQDLLNESHKLKDDVIRMKIQNAVWLITKEITGGIIFPITYRYPDLDSENAGKIDDAL